MQTMKKIGLGVGVLLVLVVVLYLTGYAQKILMTAFLAYSAPAGDFDPAHASDPPDYSDTDNWAALPSLVDPADLVPLGVSVEDQGQLPVDTFFIHPTGYLKSASWTSPMDPDSSTEENTLWMMANQASAYNGCCNVYAPRYREATIFSYLGDEEVRDEVLGFAYLDVKRAFEYYLEHYNEGRPFIIASHSQGTHHALRLLKDIDSSELHERMVAAYLIGSVLIPLSPSWFDSMSHISACERADDIHCVVHWDTMPEGAPALERPAESLCTNPLTWQVNEEVAAAELNTGAVIPEGTYNLSFGGDDDLPTQQNFASLDAPIDQHTWAQCREGTLYVQSQEGSGFDAMGSGSLGSYHGLDYALFYMNIHNNSKLRADRFLARQGVN